MLATHYVGSKGPVLIASMPFPHLQNAHRKLAAADDPSRSAEVDAMAARLAELEAEGHAQYAAPTEEADNPRVVIGGNNPPVEPANPFDAIKVNMDDLLIESRNWADGVAIETQAQADEVSRLIEDLRKAGDAADDERVKEKKPLDDQIDAIQTRYNAYIAGLKSKVKNPGNVTIAIDALKATLKPYLDKLEADRVARETEAREAAAKLAGDAAAALQAAQQADLPAREEAEALVEEAAAAQTLVRQIVNDRPQARGGDRAMSLRRYWVATLTDRRAALLHYLVDQPDAITAYLQTLADADVRVGKRKLPGFAVTEETRL
jgi:hypothetical protein